MTATPSTRKYFTVAEANAMLPLVRSIVKDVTELAAEMRARHQRIEALQEAGLTRQEELDELITAMDRDQERMEDLVGELTRLGIELKDFFIGLIDFRALKKDREVYLCWKLGEPEVGHWHDIEAGFAGRQKIVGRW